MKVYEAIEEWEDGSKETLLIYEDRSKLEEILNKKFGVRQQEKKYWTNIVFQKKEKIYILETIKPDNLGYPEVDFYSL